MAKPTKRQINKLQKTLTRVCEVCEYEGFDNQQTVDKLRKTLKALNELMEIYGDNGRLLTNEDIDKLGPGRMLIILQEVNAELGNE